MTPDIRTIARRAAQIGLLAALLAVPGHAVRAQAADEPGTPGACRLDGDHQPTATIVTAGETLRMSLHLAATCPVGGGARADIFLLLDRSSSMGQDGKLASAHTAVRNFVSRVDFNRHRVGLVPFTSQAYVLQTLTYDPERVLEALDRSGPPEQATNIARAIEVANEEFNATARPGAVRVMVLLTDGRSNSQAMAAAALGASEQGTVIFAIALGPDADQDALRRVASSNDHLVYAPTADDLEAVYTRIASIIQSYTVTNVTIGANLGPGTGYVPGSGDPDDPGGASQLLWSRPVLAGDGATISYDVRMSRPGRFRPVTATWADYVDGDGSRRHYVFPTTREVEVLPPVTWHAYLPSTWQGACVASTRGSDVVLAIDNSDSMRGEKLSQAVSAAASFVRLLDPRRDQAGVVAYDGRPHTVVSLTSDWNALDQGLATIVSGNGTRLDHGVEAAAAELLGPAHRPENRSVIVLLSDGRQTQDPGAAISAAVIARSAGVQIFAVGLGADADMDLLAAVAGTESRTFFASGPETLTAIYQRIGGAVSCR